MSLALYEQRGAISIITLNNPARLNAIGEKLLYSFNNALIRAIESPTTATIVITGAGRAFCAGDDLKEFDWENVKEEAVRAHIGDIQKITKSLMGCDKPVVGAIHGYAVGGGFEWLLNCDLVVASSDLIAFFPEMDWGFFVTGGVTHLLPQAVGRQKAMELLLLGERQTADTLHALGLINWVVSPEEMLPKALEVAENIAKKSRASVASLKKTINEDLGHALWQAVGLEEKATIEAFLRPDARERAQRFTNEKNNPD